MRASAAVASAHPVQLSLLRSERSLLANAVDELLRYDSGWPSIPRYVLEDFELRGRTLKKGQLVALSLIGANRDPRVSRIRTRWTSAATPVKR